MNSTTTTLETRPAANVERIDRYRTAAQTAATAIAASKKTNTTRAYRTDLARFGAFATGTTLPATGTPNRNTRIDELMHEGEQQLPADPSTLAVFVGDMIEHGLAPSSIDRALSAIGKRTRELHGIRADFTHARAALKGYERARTEDGHTTDKAAPFRLADLERVCAEIDLDTTAGLRDRCALTLWYFGGLRRSELVRLRLGDVTEIPGKGLELRLRNAKTGTRTVAIPARQDRRTDPLRAFCAWLDHLNAAGQDIDDETMLIRSVHRNGVTVGGSLSDKAAATMLVRSAETAELPTERLSGHSPRRGLATDLAEAGAARSDIEKAGGWATGSSVVTGYLDEADLWANNPLALL